MNVRAASRHVFVCVCVAKDLVKPATDHRSYDATGRRLYDRTGDCTSTNDRQLHIDNRRLHKQRNDTDRSARARACEHSVRAHENEIQQAEHLNSTHMHK